MWGSTWGMEQDMEQALTVPIRPAVDALPRYRPGRSAPGAAKISSNEMPAPPSSRVIDAAIAALAEPNRYPDLMAVRLREALAAHHGVAVPQICVGTGSSAILVGALSAVCEPGAEVVFPWRSFESYPIAVPSQHAVPRPVPLAEGGRHDLPAMCAAVGPNTAALILCSPNNPTGPALTLADIRQVLAGVPETVLVLVDEAYIEFATDEGVSTAIPLIAEYPNLLVMRTFSKAYSLAGLRVGYAVGHPALIGAIQAVLVPFGVSTVAQAGALAALEDEGEVGSAIARTVAERDRVVAELRELGYTVPHSQANFYFLPGLGHTFVQACREAGLIVRPFPEGVRVTVGTAEQNDALIEVARGLRPS